MHTMMPTRISVRLRSWLIPLVLLSTTGCAHSRPSLYPRTRSAAKPVVIGDRFHIPEPYHADTTIVRPGARVRSRVLAPSPTLTPAPVN
ncbi:MAG TPA: hypothetical protein VG406_02530 [Isosphaeraceae bacterium]|nr:hypothetical protein [Isosphaeraceae bacterium]